MSKVVIGHSYQFISYVQRGGGNVHQISYSPFQKTNLVPQDKIEELSHIIKKGWNNFKAKPHQLLPRGKFIVFGNKSTEIAEKGSAKVKEKIRKNPYRDIPEEVRKEIDTLKIENNLNQAQIKKMIRVTQKKKIKKLEIEKQIEHLKAQASKFGDNRYRKRTIKQFNKSYDKFINALNSDLSILDQYRKKEITTKLEIMLGAIQNNLDSLK